VKAGEEDVLEPVPLLLTVAEAPLGVMSWTVTSARVVVVVVVED
jgi:hypothetical protein